MSRFERISGRYINVDKIRCYWREGERGECIAVELDDGGMLREHDVRRMIERCIDGVFHIVQIIPCIKPLYARYTEDGKEVESPIYYLGLCASGHARPLDICGADGVGFADESCNYVGLYCETLEEERKENA